MPKEYRIYSEVFITADSEAEAYNQGCSRLNARMDDYEIEEVQHGTKT